MHVYNPILLLSVSQIIKANIHSQVKSHSGPSSPRLHWNAKSDQVYGDRWLSPTKQQQSCVESDKCLLVTKLKLIELEPVLIHNTAIMICKLDQIVYTKIEIFIGTNKELK